MNKVLRTLILSMLSLGSMSAQDFSFACATCEKTTGQVKNYRTSKVTGTLEIVGLLFPQGSTDAPEVGTQVYVLWNGVAILHEARQGYPLSCCVVLYPVNAEAIDTGSTTAYTTITMYKDFPCTPAPE